MTLNGKSLFNLKDDDEWIDLLIRSVNEPIIDNFEMPRFPHGAIQRQFVGSSDSAALREGFVFYREFKKYSINLGRPINRDAKFLDFGCGWGRYTRIFWNDIEWNNIHGVDIDPDMIAICKALKVPGTYTKIDPKGALPFEDNYFDFISAYSVFSHLPQEVATLWIKELSRVTAPGGIIALTTEPRRFLDFVENIDESSTSSWHSTLAKHKSNLQKLRAFYDNGDFAYIPTGGGAHRDAEIYGEACIPERFFKERWNNYYNLIDYVDDVSKFWQAFVVLQKDKC